MTRPAVGTVGFRIAPSGTQPVFVNGYKGAEASESTEAAAFSVCRPPPMTAVCEPMPDRIETFRVLAGGIAPVGWIRLSRGDEIRWVARSPNGSVRRFSNKFAAITWLCQCEPVPA